MNRTLATSTMMAMSLLVGHCKQDGSPNAILVGLLLLSDKPYPETEAGLGTSFPEGVEGEETGTGTGTDTPAHYTVGGVVWSVSGALTIQNNGVDDKELREAGEFEFPTPLANESAYNVTVSAQPKEQYCEIRNPSGAVSGANVTDVTVLCHDSGSFDSSFDEDGVFTHHNAAGGYGSDYGHAVTLQPDGKILVAGSSVGGTPGMALWRLLPDGSLDTTFGENGIFVHQNDGSCDALGVAIQADGKIVVAGHIASKEGNPDMAVWRFRPDGKLDNTFDGDGVFTHHNAAGGNRSDYGRAIALQANGKIIVAGHSHNANGNPDMALWRLNADGSLDTTFGENGIVTHHKHGADYGHSVAIQGDGKIVVAGSSVGVKTGMAFWRFEKDGSPDITFNKIGRSAYGNDYGRAVTVQPDGKILIAGHRQNAAGDLDMAVWRFGPDGTPDTAFGGDGMATQHNAAGGNGSDYAHAMALQPDGRIIVAGYSRNAEGNLDMALWRLRTNGTPDTALDTDGVVTHHNAAGGGGSDYAHAVALQPDGKIVIVGTSLGNKNPDTAIWRILP